MSQSVYDSAPIKLSLAPLISKLSLAPLISIHDGSLSSPAEFLGAVGFTLQVAGPKAISQVESFLFAFDSNLFPAVGQQITLRPGNLNSAGSRQTLLAQRAANRQCDLVVHGTIAGRAQGFLYSNGSYLRDRAADAPVSEATLRQWSQQAGQELTWTCTPPGSGRRIGIDRDLDGVLDGDEG